MKLIIKNGDSKHTFLLKGVDEKTLLRTVRRLVKQNGWQPSLGDFEKPGHVTRDYIQKGLEG